MILAGIDEAGLGPNLGPLVTACAALRVPDGWRPDDPWDKLAAACRRGFRRGEKRLPVADSKVVYSRGGAKALAQTLAAFARALPAEENAEDASAERSGPAHPCYADFPPPAALFPAGEAENAESGEKESAAALAAALAEAGAEAVRLEAGVLFERTMNLRFAAGKNKNQVLLEETGARLSGLAAAFPEEPVLAVVDKQGGRNDYLPFLTELFPGAWVETVSAGAAAGVYRVRRGGSGAADADNVLEVRFAAKGDRDSFATALASMAAKCARERAMAALNSWFCARVPGLAPTAGYPADAKRWRADVLGAAGADSLHWEHVWRIR